MLARIGNDWVSFVGDCVGLMADASDGWSTGATSEQLLFDTFVQGRNSALRHECFLNLGTFASHVSLLLANVSPTDFHAQRMAGDGRTRSLNRCLRSYTIMSQSKKI